MKIKDVISEAFGTRRVRDPSGSDYETDPETGEYTGRQEVDPNSFTNMISGVADRIGAGSGSQWVQASEPQPRDKFKQYMVPPGKMLITKTQDGRLYYKFAAKINSKDKTGTWMDSTGREIVNDKSIASLEKLAQQNGKLTFDPNAHPVSQTDMPAQDTSSDELVGEPSVSEPLHPDVSVVQSVPLVLQYKGKRFEMDDFGEFHPFGTTKKITPALQTFLSKERSKL